MNLLVHLDIILHGHLVYLLAYHVAQSSVGQCICPLPGHNWFHLVAL